MAESELTTLNGPLPIVHWIVQGWRRVESKWWSCCGAGTVAGWLWHRWDILTTFCIHLLNEWEKMTQVNHTSCTLNSHFLATGTSWVNSTPRHMIIDWEKYTIVFWCRTSSSTPSVTTNFPSGENYNHQFSKWNQLCFRDLRMLLKSTDIAMSKARHPSLLPRWQSIIKYSQVEKYHQILPGGKILSNIARWQNIIKEFFTIHSEEEKQSWAGLPPAASSLRWSTSSWSASVTSASSWTRTTRRHRTSSTVSRCSSTVRWSHPVRRQTLTIDQESVPVHEETLQLNTDSSMRLLYQKSVQVFSKCEFYQVLYTSHHPEMSNPIRQWVSGSVMFSDFGDSYQLSNLFTTL